MRLMLCVGALSVALAVGCQPAVAATGVPPSVVLSGQVELARLVDLAAARLGVRVEYDAALLKGAVTVRGGEDGGITDDELWDAVNSALAGRGFTTIASTQTLSRVGRTGAPGGNQDAGATGRDVVKAAGGDVDRTSYTVVRLTDAAGLVLPEGPFEGSVPSWKAPGPGFAAVFFKVNNRTTKVTSELIKPLMSKTGSSVTPVGESDLLLVADLTPRLMLIADFLKRIDVPQAQTEVAEVPLANITTAEVLTFIKELGTKREGAAQRPPGEVLQQPGSNSVLVLAPREHLVFWKDLIGRLDTKQPVETRNYTSRQVEAKSLARLVEQIAGLDSAPNSGSKARVIVDEFTGTLIVTATASQHAKVAELLSRIDSAGGGPPKQVRTFAIRNRPVKEIVSVLNQLLGTERLENTSPLLPKTDPANVAAARRPDTDVGGKKDKDGDRTQITADDGTNTLIVIAEPRVLGQIEDVLKTLDVRQPQVMIEVAMVSLTDGQSRALSVELDKLGSLSGGATRLSSIFTGGSSGNLAATPGAGMTASYINVGDFSAVLRALEAVNSGRSTSVPSILVTNNEQATFNSVVQQPTSSVSTDTTSTTTRGFTGFQDAGTRISVKPQIAEGDHLSLTYNIELSSFTGNPTSDGLPGARQQNTVGSVAMIPDGHAVVVGGIELNSDTDDTSRTPVLGELPVVGWLFRSSKVTHDRTRFFVLIKANIMRDAGFGELKYLSGRTVESQNLEVEEGWPVVEPRVIR